MTDIKQTPLWRNVSFLLMWSSTAASGFGDRMMILAAMALLGGVAGSADSAGISAAINFWFFLPYLIFCVPAGWLADRLPRKWMLLSCDEARALILLACFLLLAKASGQAVLGKNEHWRVMLAMFAVGIFAAIFSPVRNATIPQIVPLKQLQPANAMIIVISVIASLIGLRVGGWLIDPEDAVSVRGGLLIAVVFYGVSGFFFAFLKVRKRQQSVAAVSTAGRKRVWASRYIFRHRRVMVLIAMNMFVWGSAMVVVNAVISLCKNRYSFTDSKIIWDRYTQMAGLLGAGMLVGAIVVAWIKTRRESGLVIVVGLFLAGLCMVVLSISRSYMVGMIAAFGVGLFGNIVIVSVATMLQTITPNYIRGRVMGVNSTLNTGANVAVNFAIWRMTNADAGVLLVLYTLGPMFLFVGCVLLVYQTRGLRLQRGLQTLLARGSRLFALVWHRLEWRGRHRIPHAGAVILVSNHTTGLDPVLIQAATPRLIRWLMIDKYQLRVLGFLWRAIKPITFTQGNGATAPLRAVGEALNNGEVVGIFPEGGLQREHRQLQPFAPGVAMIAKRHEAAWIVPVWIEGTPRTRSLLWHFLKPSRCVIYFGEPYHVDAAADRNAVLDDLRGRIEGLGIRQ